MKKHVQRFLQLLLLVTFLSGNFVSHGQGKPDKKPIPQAALEHIKKNKQKHGLEDIDIADLELSSSTESKKSGVKHVYLKQLYNGIEIHGAVTNISMNKHGKVITMGNRFHKQIGKKIKPNQASLDAAGAVAAAAKHLGITMKGPLTVLEKGNGRNKEVLFDKSGISLESIPAKLVYQPMEDGSIRLAWEVSIYELDAQNWWNIRMDASTGEILDKDNMVVHCQFENDGPGGQFLEANHSHTLSSPNVAAPQVKAESIRIANAFNVFAMPYESPSHGPREIVSTSAADANASPNGWNTETRTRGNNVFAYEDPNNNNSFSTNYSPDGGSDFNFDFPIDFTKQPVVNRDAAITNLFYWNNVIHDVWYQYGFDEESGSFQLGNYGKGGIGGDPVLAEAQDNRNGTSRNNANFSTPRDGFAPRMQMYLWSSPADPDMFRVTSPTAIAGSYIATEAAWAKKLDATPLTGKLVVAIDGSSLPNEGCNTFLNAADIAGNIAVVYRGTCAFTQKVENAQAAGAIAVVVINNAGGPIAMGGTPTVPITIPAVMIGQGDGALVRARIDANEQVLISLKDEGGPEIDGDFDNGIITHEYGHGISNRLTGGPNITNCLNNAEQMGEGWSDWFGLMMTMRPGDTGGKVRGIGTYASGQATDGNGIRPAPYSTNFGVNGFTYAATNNAAAISQPHGIGFVWSTMLWDMTWSLIEKYGFDADLYNGNGGNNMAMQLVIDGLKLQACRPGFVDGRDAILLADRQNFEGANQQLIWEAFAKRGLGFSASQGLNTSRADQVEAFDLPDTYACTTPLTVAAIPTSDVFTGGVASTLYLGYGPQNVKLQLTGDADNDYTWSPATGLNTTTGAEVTFTPDAPGIYTFTVTAENGDGCIKRTSIAITVIDVRCGDNKKKDKVLVCVDGVAECVSPKAVPYLLTAAKANLGDCSIAATATAAVQGETNRAEKMALKAVPNPFNAKTDIGFTLSSEGTYRLEVLDIRGAVVAVLAEGAGKAGEHHTYQLEGRKLAGGMYIARLVTNEGVSFTRIILQK